MDECDDADGDGLYDVWEKQGIDFDNDGTVDLDLPALGANWQRKDLFLEIDYMGSGGNHTHKPRDDAINDVKNAFKNAPVKTVKNPDGSPGITLHIDVDDEIPHKDAVNGWDEFDSIKSDYFGTKLQRESVNNNATLSAKKLVYRYALFIHDFAKWNGTNWILGGILGIAELAGNDLIVSLGTKYANDRFEQAGTLMHELGHTLNLRHGGGDGINGKPNYLSILTYSRLDYLKNHPIDYSRQKLPTLDENNLNEADGIRGPRGEETVWGIQLWNGTAWKYQVFRDSADGPIDWNANGNNTETGLRVSINNFRVDGDIYATELEGYDDWANLQYNFRASEGFADRVHTTAVEGEPTWEMIDEIRNTNVTGFHDIAITDMAISNLVAAQGDSININVTVLNQGAYAETFNATIYANSTELGKQTFNLDSGASAVFEVTWDTTGFSLGKYVVRAYAMPVPDEIDATDNENLKYARVWEPGTSATITQITNSTNSESPPQISAGQVVWSVYKDGDWEVFMYDTATRTTTKVSNYEYERDDVYPQLNDGKIVWQNALSYNIAFTDVYLYDIATGNIIPITYSWESDNYPQVDDGKVVWQTWQTKNGTTDWEVFLYDISTNTTIQLTDNDYYDGSNYEWQGSPKIDNGYIVWTRQKFDDYGIAQDDAEIILYEISTGKAPQITNNTYSDVEPRIDSGKIVWTRWDKWNGVDLSTEIFLYDISTNVTTRVTNNNYDDKTPRISDGKIVWESWDRGIFLPPQILLYDSSTGTTTQITSEGSGNSLYINQGMVVWVGSGQVGLDIFQYDSLTGTTTQITNSTYAEDFPKIDNGQIVWLGWDGADWEVFLYSTVSGTQPPPPYDATVETYCLTDRASVSVNITMDNTSTGFNTTHKFAGLTDTHTFTVPNVDPHGHIFKKWNTGNTNTTTTVNAGGTYTAYYEGPSTPYNVTITAHSYTTNTSVSVPITMDGLPTGYTTPYTFTGLTGIHNFTVPNTASGQNLKHWSTGSTGTTINVDAEETYTAYYKETSTLPPPYTASPPPLPTLLPIPIQSSDEFGNPKDLFGTDETLQVAVPVIGQTVSIYVVANKTTWNDGDTLIDVSGGVEKLTLNLPPGSQTIQIWTPLLTIGNYSIVIDLNNNGILDLQIDLIDYTCQVVDTTKPVANAGPNQTVNVGATVNFDASSSTDNVGIISYAWDFGDGTTGTGKTTTHAYTGPGTYTARLTVQDQAGNNATATVTATVLTQQSSQDSSSSSSSSSSRSKPKPQPSLSPTPEPEPTPTPEPEPIPIKEPKQTPGQPLFLYAIVVAIAFVVSGVSVFIAKKRRQQKRAASP